MFRLLKLFILVSLLSGLFFSGCAKYKKYVPPDKLNSKDNGAMEVLTNDGTTYRLRRAMVYKEEINGRGYKYNLDSTREMFSGSIPISEISIVQVRKKDGFASLMALSTVSFLIAGTNYVLNKEDNEYSTVEVSISYPSSGGGYWGSCPYVFTFDGEKYHFESETFAGAICKGLERTNLEPLYYLKPVKGEYKLALANQSPESQHVNEIILIAADHPPGTKIVPDPSGVLHTLENEHPPVSAYSFFDKDVLSEVAYDDNIYYESDIDAIDVSRDEHLRDGIICEFLKPENAEKGKLLIKAVNTSLGYFALEKLFASRGPNKLSWYHRLNTDVNEQKKLFNWIRREGWLEISIWQDSTWTPVNYLPDFGPRKAGEKVVILDLTQIKSDRFKIKLESATDLWRIDKIAIDYSNDKPIQLTPLPLTYAVNDRHSDVTNTMKSIDSLYFSTVPGDYALLSFNTIPSKDNLERTMLLKSTGYYYSWIDEDKEDNHELVERILTEPQFGNRLHLKEWLENREQYTINDGAPVFKIK